MNKEKKNKKIIILSLFIILLVTILGLGIYGYYKVLDTDLIYEGIQIDELNIGFKTKEETLRLLKDKKENLIDENSMTLTYGEEEYNITLRELGFYFDYNKAVDKAYLIGREGNIIERIKEIIATKKEGVKLELESNYDEKTIESIVDTIAEEINLEMVEAGFDFNYGNPIVSEETIGKDVKKEELIKSINENVYTLNPIEIPVENIMPGKTKEVLSRVNGVIGEYSTSFKTSSPGRIENIKISSNAIKGNLIMPGETFSFNQTTGPRESGLGYQEANVIIEGELTPGVGGGVCQTSTTLYNALLLSDVTITERSPHSIPANYVKYGQDAAVAYGYLDLKFRNDFEFPVYIDSKVVDKQVYMYVYGDRNTKNYRVQIDPEIVETIQAKEELIQDKNLGPGTKKLVQSGRTGYKVNTFKSIIKDGKVISKDMITKDFYRPRNFIYRIGPNN